GAGALVAAEQEPLHEAVHVDALSGRHLPNRIAHELARWHALEDGVDRSQDESRLAAATRYQSRQRRHAPGDDLGVGPDAVIRNRIPGREGDDAHLRIEE